MRSWRTLRARFSLRALFGVLLAISITLAVALVVMTTLLSQSAEEIARDSDGWREAAELKADLYAFNRLANLSAAAPARSDLSRARDRAAARAERGLATMPAHVSSPAEGEVLHALAREARAYIKNHRSLRVDSDRVETLVLTMRPPFESLLARLEVLRKLKEDAVLEAQREVQLLNGASIVLAVLAALCVLVSGAIGLFTRSHVFNPLEGIARALDRFRVDKFVERAPEPAPVEVKRVAQAFTQMADNLIDEREQMLSFLAGIAHDLRNPLSSLKMGTAFLLNEPSLASPKHAAILQLLDRQTERLNRLVNDLLEASQIEAGQLALRPEPVDLSEIAREMVRFHATDSSLHPITLKCCEQPVVIQGDRQRLERVLDNLISNAIKYSPGGGPVDVVVLRDEEDAIVSVADQGVGIAADEQQLIFEPFRRVSSIKDRVPGVGIGLSVVQRIVVAHQGRVEVESSPGHGATFRVRLPVRPERAPDRANEPGLVCGRRPAGGLTGTPPSSAAALGTPPVPHFVPAFVVRF